MLNFDLRLVGNRLYEIRNKKLMSRAEVAEKADISDRTYADIERGSVTMRVDSLLKICNALSITPNDVLVTDDKIEITEQNIADALKNHSNDEKETALKLLHTYIESLK